MNAVPIGIAVLGANAVLAAAAAVAPLTANSEALVTFDFPTTVCTISDTELTGLSGLTDTPQGLMSIADNVPGVFQVSTACAVTIHAQLPNDVKLIDVEDMGSTPDGTLWIGDIGGNRSPRRTVELLRWVPGEPTPTTMTLRYPAGTHDAEALLIDMREVPTIVTKVPGGKSLVFAPPRRVEPQGEADLVQLGELDVSSWPYADPAAPGSLLITGGAVAPSGVHAVLRTYTSLYEWDAPDGDVGAAITSRPPDRAARLAKEKQGEAITYSTDGRAILTGSEQVPSPLSKITLARTPPQEVVTPQSASLPLAWLVAAAAAAAIVVLALVAGARGRRKRQQS